MTVYYYDSATDTVRRYPDASQEGERWDKEQHCWSKDCCPQSGCRWDEEIEERQAERIISAQ